MRYLAGNSSVLKICERRLAKLTGKINPEEKSSYSIERQFSVIKFFEGHGAAKVQGMLAKALGKKALSESTARECANVSKRSVKNQ